ncbi:MAG: glycosyltransferase family 2 protein [Firmicutes bacterium]|nr:glycosyltransferase family 2 protein [Bacillota bacterium]
MKKVQVLLSTYNGSKYLRPLLDSLLNQDYANLEILIRDDGSTDDTPGVLEEYLHVENVRVLREKNIGVAKSFFRLLSLSSHDADYLAFCDQDDIWESDKISRAVDMLSSYHNKEPALYFSRLKIVDEDLSFVKLSEMPQGEPSFRNALVQNIATGCTIVINAKARDLIVKNLPSSALWHDWWAYLVVSAFGKVVFDEEAKILYRQHSSNAVGSKVGFLNSWAARAQRFTKTGHRLLITKQAEEFNRIFSSCLDKENYKVLKRFILERKTLWGRIKYAVSPDVYRQTRLDNIVLRLLIAFNRL